ncbi:MAG: histidine kinase dimerization/phosphoacceptor domain -containing protein [Cyclobacteriaceae bacterium]
MITLSYFSPLCAQVTILGVTAGNAEENPRSLAIWNQEISPDLGQSYWLKIKIDVDSSHTYFLKGGNWYMQGIHFYDHTGTFLKQGNRVRLMLTRGSHVFYLYYPFFDEKDANYFTVEFYDANQFLALHRVKEARQYSFQAILIFVFFIGLIFGLVSRDLVYLYYGLYALSISVFFGYQYGLLGNLIPVVSNIPPTWFWLLAVTITLFYALFSISFLDMKRQDIKAYRVMVLGIWYMLGLLVLSTTLYLLELDVQHSYYYKIPTIGIEVVLISMAIYRITKFDGLIKKYYLLGVSVLVLVSIGGQLVSTLKLVENFNNVVQAGLILELLILSVGLGVRVDQIQKVKNRVQKDLITQLRINESVQEKYAEQLRHEVERRTSSLVKRNKEVQILLKEIHHRVKNNLQMITSLISMQQRRSGSDMINSALEATSNKIKSISLIHEHLYNTDNLGMVKIHDYVRDLVQLQIDSMYHGQAINCHLDIENISLKTDQTIPFGLIITELVTNSIKYAFHDHESPKLSISLRKEGIIYKLHFEDNGANMEPFKTGNEGLGFTIIKSILENFDGQMEALKTNKGFKVSISMAVRNTTA